MAHHAITDADVADFGSDGNSILAARTEPRPPTPIDPADNFPSRAIVGRKTVHVPDWDAVDLPATATEERSSSSSISRWP